MKVNLKNKILLTVLSFAIVFSMVAYTQPLKVFASTGNTVTFVVYDEDYYSSDMDGEYFIFVGFKGDKAYAMGNNTNADGSREAVEIAIKPNGAIDASSDTAEFFSFCFDVKGGGYTFSPDGKYMSVKDGKIITYDKSRVGEEGLPRPVMFNREDIYQNKGYFYHWGIDEYICFDQSSLTFKVTSEHTDSIVPYKQVCAHEGLVHIPDADPTCTQQGVYEYWYCDTCYEYYQNNDFDVPVQGEDEWDYISPETFTIPALGHKYNNQGVCENCLMERPVYRPVTSLEQFDSLSENASYIIVFKDGDKAYAAFTPITAQTPYDVDENKDGIPDIILVDTNENEVPDCIEQYYIDGWGFGEPFEDGIYGDNNENGVLDAEDFKIQVGDYDQDDVVGMNDYVLFMQDCHLEFVDLYRASLPNFVEVSVGQDGSVVIVDEGAMEFQLMPSGIWGGQEFCEEDFEYNLVDRQTERVCAAWVPNWWIASEGMMGYYDAGHFIEQYRVYGDNEYPGVMDNKNWKISFNNNGTVNMVCSWTEYDDTGVLQLVKYGDDKMTIVGLPQEQWEYSNIMPFVTESLPAYLYASEAVYATPPHTCTFGDWYEIAGGMHKRDCSDPACDKFETAQHSFGDWAKFDDNQHQRECGVCGAKESANHDFTSPWSNVDEQYHSHECKTEGCNATQTQQHSFGEWGEYAGFEGMTRHCTADGCDAYETKPVHVCEFSNWIPDPNNDQKHIRTCECGNSESGDHDFGDWATKNEHMHTRTCSVCNVTEDFEHSFNDWIAQDDVNHIHQCMECPYSSVLAHAYVREVTLEPTETQVGEATYTCSLCSHFYTEELAKRVSQISNQTSQATLTVPSTSNAYIPEGTVFDVAELPTSQVPEQVLGNIELKAEGLAKPLACYELSLLLEGAEIQPDGSVKITLPALQQEFDADSVVVVYIAPDGSYQECATTVNADGTITFETNHFSKYAVIGISEKTGLGAGAIIGIVAGAVVVVGLGGFAIYWFVFKKRRLQN